VTLAFLPQIQPPNRRKNKLKKVEKNVDKSGGGGGNNGLTLPQTHRVAGGGLETKVSMNSRLQQVQNWPERADKAKWSAKLLAENCKVSVRTLERFFCEEMGVCPHAWLFERRMRQAFELLRDGSSVKETADLLGYKKATDFSRTFKKRWGHSPTARANTFEV
jgi:transcriptional regulator GlxA family with amidase domain